MRVPIYTQSIKKRWVVSTLLFIGLTDTFLKQVTFTLQLTVLRKLQSLIFKKIIYKTINRTLFKNSVFVSKMNSLFLFNIFLTALCWQIAKECLSDLFAENPPNMVGTAIQNPKN